MVKTWSWLPHVRPSAHVLGEVVLAFMLVATLGFTSRDAVSASPDSLIGPNVHFHASLGEQPSFGLALPGLSSLAGVAAASGAAVSSNALIPTAPPAQLLIPSLNIHRPVEGVGVNRFGVMNLPVNGWNAGWFKGGPIPGAPGDAVIEGHAGYPDQPMIFGKLSTLRTGDQVLVVLGDGSKRLFAVVSKATFPVGSGPAGMGEPYGPPRLTLVTCTGSFDANTFSYSRRLVVELSYAGLA
ncbi:MAG TPA: class F sortase [Candidatus Acidoferrum sp.]|nr:class F sortase [Candidatus Acidoferrum sp.]